MKKSTFGLAMAVLAALAVFTFGPADRFSFAQDKIPPPSRPAIQYSYAPIVRAAAPAVVNVYVRSRVQTFNTPFGNDPWFRRFFGEAFGQPSERVMSSLGSGVIVSPDGLIVTNSHVVKGRGETEIRVALSDKREFDAKVIAQDEKADIAVLKIENGDGKFQFLQFDDSDSLEVGDLVLAIGNPFGVGQTVTSGIVSALSRSEMAESDSQVFIQTDAAINPGNSGGALVDMSGRLVGINTMIYSQTGGSVGIGFAIPSNLVRVYAESAAQGRKVERPWIGAKLEAMSHDIAEGLGLKRVSGAVVTRLYDKGPAADAGLNAGDVITNVDGVEVADARAVYYRLATRGIGQTAKLVVIRNGSNVDISLPLIAAPKPGKNDARNLSGNNPLDGARISNILPSVADELSIDQTDGVAIVSVRNGSVAQNLGFQPGDIIVSIQGKNITNVLDAETAVATRQRVWQVSVKRGARVLQLQVPG
ncbi:serine protease [Hyphomicrobium methylovorum]|uniref:Do family serine endopeptidase n=1 Tax=Hyphomicrobium methylovorum TaxID=84 RepID=UPI0015E6FF64|nr:serine protease [Hyphomicrobium methylovorum]